MKRTSWVAGFLLVVLGLVAGCSGLGPAPAGALPGRTEAPQPAVDPAPTVQPKRQASQPNPAAPPAVTIAATARDEGAAGQPTTQTGSQLAATANDKLILYKSEVGFTIMVPAGWTVMPTALGDLVQWSHEPVRLFVHTTQRRGAAIPQTVAAMERYLALDSGTADAQVRPLQVAGAASAFEAMYITKEAAGEMAHLELYLFGSTYKEVLWFMVPAQLYPQWEPLFRQIIGSLQPANLDAVPLPGRP